MEAWALDPQAELEVLHAAISTAIWGMSSSSVNIPKTASQCSMRGDQYQTTCKVSTTLELNNVATSALGTENMAPIAASQGYFRTHHPNSPFLRTSLYIVIPSIVKLTPTKQANMTLPAK
mmetsp:Transcript_6747/g.9163  ORF Transcript_6747/g.9163 Transcript_6747/m.9163 type:complete len:120 (-) Transcript_6747:189-548(-)